MTEQSLFPDMDVSIEQRVQNIDAEILWLLCGKPGGPLNLTLSDDEKAVLAAIRYSRGAANAYPIREMQRRPGCERLTDREIKKAVRTLRINFRLPIGSSKQGSSGGYFIMLTDEDHSILRNQVLDQVRAELEVLKSVDGPRAALELLGQLQLEVS
jgi:hypothetical protein